MYKSLVIIVFLLVAFSTGAFAQLDTSRMATKEEVGTIREALDGTNETVSALKTTLDALKKIKVSGYIQFQYQLADSAAVPSYEGGDFPANVRSRFMVRRGRLKVVYDNDLSQYALEIDASQSGVSLRDAYIWFKEPWMRTFAFTGGQFYRPFGYEVLHSHSVTESPEFARVTQILFPSEREVGAQLEVAPEIGTMSNFNLKAGIFNGSGINASENDRNKDFIGRAGYQLPFEEQNLSIDGGVSIYSGKVTANSKNIYQIDNSAANKVYRVDSAASNAGGSYGRAYYGVDLQFYYDIPDLGGMSLKGEFLTGQQPGTSGATSFYNPGSTVTPLYIRNFSGWYLTFVQNIGLKNQFIAKYDVYDPNTDVEGSDIGKPGTNLTTGDIRYSTIGLGWAYYWDSYLKLTFYYDLVTNESVNAAAASSLAHYTDDIKDNVMTIRMQYKF